MSDKERPDEKEMLYQLWYAIIGSNGDGMASQMREHTADIKELKRAVALPHVCTKEDVIVDIKKEVDTLVQAPGRLALKVFIGALAIVGTGALGWAMSTLTAHLVK
jgi:hypothetical protein